MFPVTCFAKQYIKFINLNGKSTTPFLNLSVLFIFQSGAGFIKDSFIKIRKQLQKYFGLSIQINIDLGKSNFPKIVSCIFWFVQITLSLIPSLKAAEKLNCSLFVHPWDMQMDGRMAKYWLPWLVGLCQLGSLKKMRGSNLYFFFKICETLLCQREKV